MLSPTPAVSILMPCYNTADTLKEALDSIDQQTFSNYEIIAVDDGSTDNTLKILQERARSDDRMKVVTQPHGGIISALNNGLGSCRASTVTRMDSDDRSHPERISRQFNFMETHPEIDVVGCLVKNFPSAQVREGFRIYLEWNNSLISNSDIRREMFVESPLVHPSVTYRREVIEKAGRYKDFGWAEDYDLWLRLYLSGIRFAKIPEFLLEWREYPERLTRTDSRYSVKNFLRAKAHYLALGPLKDRDGVIIWGAGMMGRRLSKHLLRKNIPLKAFVDIDPRKIGRTRRGFPIISPDELLEHWQRNNNTALLAAVGARGARILIRERLISMDLVEGEDWWGAA